ncbi:MAG: hypothetical protein DRR04_00795 [Gammaproteobacteria bacterium]|nr:MAG: hypothetical protein DRQ97_00260 [Gammaproteobacteria bacterium]RLA62259.1 MAG: hypothetical protein DRR04_00795 [Gammaproteobacteria bacterium]
MTNFFRLVSVLLGLFSTCNTLADALITNRSMFATTIAEYYIQQDQVRVELEIGMHDLPAFRNLMPDEIYEKMGNPPRPYAERVAEFFVKDLVIATREGALGGRLLEIGPRARIRRDPISGEELPVAAEDEETIIAAVLSYALQGRPPQLIFSPPRNNPMPNIGFVVYHNTVAVNDFRFLGQPVVLNLDWHDPWYTAFEQRTMRRSYFAPMSGFLYVEPFEVRKEIIVRPKDMQRWVDLGLAEADIIAADQRGAILEKISSFLMARQPVTINGEPATPILERANFLSRTLKSSMVVEAGVDINLDGAVIGVIFVYPVPSLPDNATMTWDMFDERTALVPAAAVDEAGPFKTYLEPDYAVLEWQNFLLNPTIPGLIDLASPPSAAAQWLYIARWWALGLVLVSVVVWRRSKSNTSAVASVCGLLVVGLSFILGKPLAPPSAATEKVVIDLLRNVYQAFDYREESDIYDTLERSVGGDLLTEIYLETRRSLELANQGGARAKVKTVELQDIEIQPGTDSDSFSADVTWNVIGSVGHWGHVHTRSNQYQAELSIRAVDNRWKLVKMNVLQEQRL